MAARAAVLTARALKHKCAGVVTSVLNKGCASEREIEEFRPGGERNKDLTVWGWLHFYTVLNRWLEREEVQIGRSRRPDQRKQELAGLPPGTNEIDAMAMLGGQGERLELITPLTDPAGKRVEFLTIDPKGIEALIEIDHLNMDSRWLGARLTVLQELIDAGLGSAGDVQAAQATARRIVDLLGRMVWVLTSPGPECPYDPVRDVEPDVPPHFKTLDDLDLTRFLLMHQRVHGTRLRALEAYVPRTSEARASQPGWAVFIAATAREIHEDPEHLMKHWALQKIVASAALAARARLDAEAAAKAAAQAAA